MMLRVTFGLGMTFTLPCVMTSSIPGPIVMAHMQGAAAAHVVLITNPVPHVSMVRVKSHVGGGLGGPGSRTGSEWSDQAGAEASMSAMMRAARYRLITSLPRSRYTTG